MAGLVFVVGIICTILVLVYIIRDDDETVKQEFNVFKKLEEQNDE